MPEEKSKPTATESKPAAPAAAPSPPAKKTNTLAIFGLVGAFFIPLLGLILSIIALMQIKKRNEGGRGAAIAGIAISVVVGILQAIFIVVIIIAAVSSNVTLKTYSNTNPNYTVEYPSTWQQETSTAGTAKSVIFKDPIKQTGLVTGQSEIVYIPAPTTGYKSDVLNAIRDGFKAQYKSFTITNDSRQSFKGLDSLRLVGTYEGEKGKIKFIITVILNKDNSVYTLATQAPEQNWNGLEEKFYEIHNTFAPGQ